MAIREIVVYPDEVLKKKCARVDRFDDELKSLISDMAETMYAAPGVGLAANQVGVGRQVCVIDISDPEDGHDLHVLVNPEIVERDGEVVWEEGCLSFPDMTVEVKRSASVVVQAQDADGNPIRLAADGLLAIAVQHELDHLNGVSLADKVGYLRRRMMVKDLMKKKMARTAK